MYRLTLALTGIILVGCATKGDWRDLRIDGSSETTFFESLSRIEQELPRREREPFALALVDIAQSEGQAVIESDQGVQETETYTIEHYREALDGLDFDSVIAFADEQGEPITSLYRSYRRTLVRNRNVSPLFQSLDNGNTGPVFNANGRPVPPPGSPASASVETYFRGYAD